MEEYKGYEYSIEENGYTIYLEGKAWIVQHEPYIPMKGKSYEENAKAQIDEIIEIQEETDNVSIEDRMSAVEDALNTILLG